jgi:hypothetical protein
VEIYGDDARTSYNMAQCHRLLGDLAAAAGLAEQVLLLAPDHERARALLGELSSSGGHVR